MKRSKTYLPIALAVGALALGCGKKDEGGEGKKGGGAKASGEAKKGDGAKGGLEKAAKEFDADIGKVKVDVPKGWQEQAIGKDSYIFHAPGGGFHNSNFWVAATCQGGCGSIARNLEERAKTQTESFGSTYTDYKTAKDEALADGGRVIHIEMKLKGEPAHHYERYLYKEGWPQAAMCSATLIGDQVALLDRLVAMCEGMTVEPKAQ